MVSILDSRQLNQIAGPGNHNWAVDGRAKPQCRVNDETFGVFPLPLLQLSRQIPVAVAITHHTSHITLQTQTQMVMYSAHKGSSLSQARISEA